jgi:hypothetical protein
VRGAPKRFRVDNGPEFVSRALDQWAYLHEVTLDFSQPGKPTDNALVESFNGRLRDECLNTNWFLSLDDARYKIEAWRQHYNESRPHTSLGFVPPSVFAQRAARKGGPLTRITHSQTGSVIGGPSAPENLSARLDQYGGGSHCRPKLNLSVARFSGLWVSSVRAKFAHSTLFGGRKKAHILQFVGFSVWHPDCDSVLRYLNGNSSTLTFWVPR